jgi:ubiquinone/menaquinone biosynthesis C-methylase UbiE
MRIFAIVLVAAAGWSQVATEANRNYQTPEQRAQLAQGLESPARIANLRPDELVSRMEIAPGATVVDVGAGTGILMKDLSLAVGPKGRVIEEDIHSDFLDRARGRAEKDGLGNVRFLLGTETDPNLPPGAADLVIVLDAYHHFDYPERMLAGIKRGLKPGGRLAIVEYHKKRGAIEGDPDFALTHIRAGAEEVVREVEAAGFSLVWRRDHAPEKQYIAMFRKSL